MRGLQEFYRFQGFPWFWFRWFPTFRFARFLEPGTLRTRTVEPVEP
jgi:hypothetical protein